LKKKGGKGDGVRRAEMKIISGPCTMLSMDPGKEESHKMNAFDIKENPLKLRGPQGKKQHPLLVPWSEGLGGTQERGGSSFQKEKELKTSSRLPEKIKKE